MRILLRNTTTGKYLGEPGKWIDSAEAARSFPDEERAREYFLWRKLPNIVVVKLAEPGEAEPPAPKPGRVQKIPVEKPPAPEIKEAKEAKEEIPRTELTASALFGEKGRETPESGMAPKEEIAARPTLLEKETEENAGPTEKVTVVDAKTDIGFGNSLFIRGQGAGLSWDKGQPLNCVDGTNWTWATTEARDKVVFKLLLNDQVWAKGGDFVVEAGKMIQISPAF